VKKTLKINNIDVEPYYNRPDPAIFVQTRIKECCGVTVTIEKIQALVNYSKA